MRGYFAVGVDGISKPMNLGNLLRISHAFGASFFFTIDGKVRLSDAQSDTSQAEGHLPIYDFATAAEFRLPQGCRIVGWKLRMMRSICHDSAIRFARPMCSAPSACRSPRPRWHGANSW